MDECKIVFDSNVDDEMDRVSLRNFVIMMSGVVWATFTSD